MSAEDKYTSFPTKDQEQFITLDNKILKIKDELELVKDEKETNSFDRLFADIVTI